MSLQRLVDILHENAVNADREFWSDRPTREGIPLEMWRAIRQGIAEDSE